MTRLRAFPLADFLVIQPQTFSIGVREVSSGQFEVIARASGRLALSADRLAYSAGIQRIRDNRLARDLWMQSEVAKTLPGKLSQRLSAYWKPRLYVPEEATDMVAFHDLRRGKHRIGYYLKHDNATVHFVGLSSRPEVAPRTHIAVGSAQYGQPEELLEQDNRFDFIDYCLLQVAKKLSSPDEATHHRLAIHTKIDLSNATWSRTANAPSSGPVYQFLSRVLSSNGTVRPSTDHFKVVRNALEDDLYAKLSNLGVSIVERESIQELLAEQNLAGWNKSHRFIDQLLGRKNPFGQLLYATHVLYMELGDAADPGAIRFSARLVDSYSGEVVWAKTCERPVYASSTTQQHLLTSGKVVLVNPKKNPSRDLHHPLRMPLSRAEHDLQLTRLVCLEGSLNDPMLRMRDLFEPVTTTFSTGMFSPKAIMEVRNVDQVPWEHRFRYIVWRVSQALLPPAGRVSDCGERQATISLIRANSLTSRGQPLSASRPEPNQQDLSAPVRLRELPVRLTVTEVSPNGLQVSWADPRVQTLWTSGAPLAVGDIVMRPHPQVPIVRVETPVVQRPDTTTWKKLRLDNARNRNDYGQRTQVNATRLERLLRQSLLEMRIDCVGDEGVGSTVRSVDTRSSASATHLLRAKIAPGLSRAYHVHLSVVDARTQQPVMELTTQLSEEQLEHWKP